MLPYPPEPMERYPLIKVRPWIGIAAPIAVALAIGWFVSQYADLVENGHLENANQQLEEQVTSLQDQLGEHKVECAIGRVVVLTLFDDSGSVRTWSNGEQMICARDWHISSVHGPKLPSEPQMNPWTPPALDPSDLLQR